MGLDAYVNCRCWQDGLAATPPVGPIGHDEAGWLDLLLPWEGNEAAHRAFDTWLRTACPHESMELVSERVANWGGVRLFQQALRAAGRANFPTLHDALPNANDGSVPPEQAARILAELDFFETQARVGDETVLVDEATGSALMTYVAAYDGVSMMGPGYHAGVDPDGFFVRDPGTEPPVTLFRATRFSQWVLSGEEVEFTAGEQRVRVAMPPVGAQAGTPPERLRVATHPRSTADFTFIVGRLRMLCEASVATGNPVMWT